MSEPFRVAHIVTGERFWGVETYVANLTSAFDSNEVKPLIICANAQIHEEFARRGLDSIHVAMPGPADTRAIMEIVNLVKGRGIQIVHTHLGLDATLVWFARAAQHFVHVHSVHFLVPAWAQAKPWKRALLGPLSTVRNSSIDHFLPITPQVAAALKAREGVPSEKMSVIFPGLAPLKPISSRARFEARSSFAASDSTVLIAAICRLEKEKNIQLAIDAAGLLKTRFASFQLLICGSGSEFGALQERVAALELRHHVKLLGYVADVSEVLVACDFFVHTALAEPFGLAVAEAMQMQLPVIGLSGGGLDFIVSPPETGFLLTDASPGSLARAMEELCVSSQKRTIMGRNAAYSVESNFSSVNMAADVAAVYRQLVLTSGSVG